MLKKLSEILVFATVLVSGCGSQQEYMDVGIGPDNAAEFRYRLIDLVQDGKTYPKTHSDTAGIAMEIQSGKGLGKWILLPIYDCWAPKMRDDMPSVACTSQQGSKLVIATTDNVREMLLQLKREGKRADVKAKLVGLYADMPVLFVSDPAAKLRGK